MRAVAGVKQCFVPRLRFLKAAKYFEGSERLSASQNGLCFVKLVTNLLVMLMNYVRHYD
jgi:hypothetical protein